MLRCKKGGVGAGGVSLSGEDGGGGGLRRRDGQLLSLLREELRQEKVFTHKERNYNG